MPNIDKITLKGTDYTQKKKHILCYQTFNK